MPPTGTLLSPTGARVTDSSAAQLDRIAELRSEALATVPANDYDADELARYLWYLDETETKLRASQ